MPALLADHERFKLWFGPYKTPVFRYGAIVMDEVRGFVKIVGMTDACIPWPKEQDELLGVLPDAEIVRRTGRSLIAVQCRRRNFARQLKLATA